MMKIRENIEIDSFRISYRKKLRNSIFVSTVYVIYSYLEKGCRKKVHATIPEGSVDGFEFTIRVRVRTEI